MGREAVRGGGGRDGGWKEEDRVEKGGARDKRRFLRS